MSALVEQLKSEHKWLVDKLLEVRTLGSSKKTAEALNSARKALLAHLQKEDDKLYPTFAKLEAKWGVNLGGSAAPAIIEEAPVHSGGLFKKYAAPVALAGLVVVAIAASFAYWLHGA